MELCNLFISGDDEAWETNTTYFPIVRCIKEYTDDDLVKKFISLGENEIEELKKLPCIFAYEKGNEKDASIGYITDIVKRKDQVRITFEKVNITIPKEIFESMSFELDLGVWELNRTHWAVKKVDLFKELREKGIVVENIWQDYLRRLEYGGIKMSKAFVSYSWENEEHKTWVREFAEKLRSDGVEVILDQWHLAPGDQLPQFMEKSIRDNDFVLIICTPKYKIKSDKRDGGVGYEGDIITSEVFNQRNQRKFIPILCAGEWSEASPSWLAGKYYIDLRGASYSEDNYNDLLVTLHNMRPKVPPVGRIPIERFEKNKLQLAINNNELEPIKIDGIIADEVSMPKMDGTRGSALYEVPFKLSRRPSDIWADIFIQTWNHPPKWTSMHRPGIARIYGDRIILDGTDMEEVKKYHRDTLKLCIEESNKFEKDYNRKMEEKKVREKLRIEKHEQEVRNLASQIKFD